MSGGSFDYAYWKAEQFADELEVMLSKQDEVNEWNEKPYYMEEATRVKLQEIEKMVRTASKMMKEVEWLYSGDTGEDSFMKRVAEIEAESK